jgi:uncharacterized membrane protein YfcA
MEYDLNTLFLAGVSFFTSTVSATLGFLGGTMLLTAMAQVLPLSALIPVHGAVQFFSNASRVYFLLKYVNKKILIAYGISSVLGVLMASRFLFQMQDGVYSLVLGCFILFVTLIPKPKKGILFPGKWWVVGFIASWIGLFMGAVGTFVGAMFLSEPMEKKELVATQAACQSILHILKVIVFLYLGFQIFDWLGLIVIMLITTVLGSFVGTKILDKVPQKYFMVFFKSLVILLSLKLVFDGVRALKF